MFLGQVRYGIPVRLFRISVADTAGLIREFGQEAVLVDSLSKLERESTVQPFLADIGCVGYEMNAILS